MRSVVTSLFCTLLLMMSPAMVVWAGEIYAPVSLDVRLNEAQPIHREVLGVHGELLWSPIRYGDERLIQQIHALGVQSIRIPGGTTANYYLAGLGQFGCVHPVSSERSVERIERFNAALSRSGRTYSTEDFVAFLRHAPASFSIVVNVMCDSVANTRAWMESLRKNGVRVDRVEMGNELHFEQYAWAVPTAADYVETARRHAGEVEAVFPRVNVALVGSTSSFRAHGFPDLGLMARHERHRRGLAFDTAAAQAEFGDAIVVHLYSPIGAGKPSRLFGGISLEEAYVHAVEHFDRRFPGVLMHFRTLAPSKPLWISEWGVAFYGALRRYEGAFKKTSFNGLYVANALLAYLLSGSVTQANYHNLTDLLPRKGSQAAPAPGTVAVWNLMSDAVATSNQIAPVTVQGRSRDGTPESVESDIRAAYLTDGHKSYLLLVNKFRHAYSIREILVGGRPAVPTEYRQLRSGRGHVFEPLVRASGSSAEGAIEIPPHSVTRVTLVAES